MAGAVADPGQRVLAEFDMDVDPATEAAEPPATSRPVEAPQAPPQHPNWLTKAAQRVGIDAREAAEMTTAELKEAVTVSSAHREEMRQTDRPRDDSGRFTSEPTRPSVEQKAFSLDVLGVKTADWDEMVKGEDGEERPKYGSADLLKQVVEPLYKEIQELKAQLGHVAASEARRGHIEALNALDTLFNERPDVFGKGSFKSIKPGTTEFYRRDMVSDLMRKMKAADQDLSFEEAFNKASEIFGAAAPAAQPAEQPKAKPVVKDPLNFRNGKTGMPTARVEEPEQFGPRAAEDEIRKKFYGGRGGRAPEEDEDP